MCPVVLCSDEEPGVGRGAGQLRGVGEGGGRHVQCNVHWGKTCSSTLDGDLNK